MITNSGSETSVDEIAFGIYRISTPLRSPGFEFSFNQYLVKDEDPLLFHTGLRRMFPLTLEAARAVIPPEKLRWIAFSHFEANECGALNEWLEAAPRAQPLRGQVAKLVSVDDVADREARALADGEALSLGAHAVTWLDTPHLPHAWECGFLHEATTGTLLCGDLFTQGGADNPPLPESDILGPSEAYRKPMDYFSHTRNARPMLERLASLAPRTLAVMHGSAWRGDGGALLRALADALAA